MLTFENEITSIKQIKNNLNKLPLTNKPTQAEIFNHLQHTQYMLNGAYQLYIETGLKPIKRDCLNLYKERMSDLNYMLSHPLCKFNPKNKAYQNKLNTVQKLHNKLI